MNHTFILLTVCFIILSELAQRKKHDRLKQIKKKTAIGSANTGVMIIHLPTAVQRTTHVQNMLATLDSMPITKHCAKNIIQAIDGSTITPSIRDQNYCEYQHSPHFTFQLTNNEIACFLSHKKAWQQVVDQNLSSALIMEDDVRINESIFANALQLAYNHLKENCIIRFKGSQRKKFREYFLGHTNNRLYVPYVPYLGAFTYLISQQTAVKLLKLSSTFDRPVDSFLQLIPHQGIYSAEIYQAGVKEISGNIGGSMIQHQKRFQKHIFGPIYREYLRSRFRIHLKLHRIFHFKDVVDQ
jgi:GR25 family glycosyltransferase involved in LPS biosynthesis